MRAFLVSSFLAVGIYVVFPPSPYANHLKPLRLFFMLFRAFFFRPWVVVFFRVASFPQTPFKASSFFSPSPPFQYKFSPVFLDNSQPPNLPRFLQDTEPILLQTPSSFLTTSGPSSGFPSSISSCQRGSFQFLHFHPFSPDFPVFC